MYIVMLTFWPLLLLLLGNVNDSLFSVCMKFFTQCMRRTVLGKVKCVCLCYLLVLNRS